MIVTAQELAPYFPEGTSLDKLKELAKIIENHAESHIQIVKIREREKSEYQKLKKARNAINKAIETLYAARDGFDPDKFKTLIEDPENEKEASELLAKGWRASGEEATQLFSMAQDLHRDTFTTIAKEIIRCIPEEEPKSVSKKALEQFFENIRYFCQAIDPKMSWYTYSEYDSEYSGEFFSICALIVRRLGVDIADSTISKYLKETVKPNIETMLAVHEELERQGRVPSVFLMPAHELEELKSKVQKNRKR